MDRPSRGPLPGPRTLWAAPATMVVRLGFPAPPPGFLALSSASSRPPHPAQANGGCWWTYRVRPRAEGRREATRQPVRPWGVIVTAPTHSPGNPGCRMEVAGCRSRFLLLSLALHLCLLSCPSQGPSSCPLPSGPPPWMPPHRAPAGPHCASASTPSSSPRGTRHAHSWGGGRLHTIAASWEDLPINRSRSSLLRPRECGLTLPRRGAPVRWKPSS